jgi:hypothetical protein
MRTFIQIGETRLIKSSIKKYGPNGEKKLNIYYNASRNKMDVETFTFLNKQERDEMLNTLDTLFL